MDKPVLKIMFTDFYGGVTKPVQWNPIYRMLSKYYDLELTHSPDFLIYSCFGYEYLKYDCIRIFVTGENVRPNYDECDYAFSFDYPNDERNYRLPLYRLYKGYDDLLKPRNPETVITQQRKFCGFLVSNEVPGERAKLFDMLSAYKKVESGGKFRNNIGTPVPRGQEISWFENYKFCIAFENTLYPGYTTEKLLHALVANSVPIYWGNPLVGQEFNTRAFINCHDYSSLEEVVQVIKNIDQDDNRYREILSQPYLPGGVEIEGNKEASIMTRFNQIFNERKAFIPKNKKQQQRIRYPILMTKKWFSRNVRPKVKQFLIGSN